VVDGKKYFPDRWNSFSGFIWVVWDRKDNRRFGQVDGGYERYRFQEISTQEPKLEPKNNDGRAECFWCGAMTKRVLGITSMYDICTKCGR